MTQIRKAAPQGATGATMGENPQPSRQPETIIVHETRVGCDGGAGASQGALGHPLVYISLAKDNTGQVSGDCGYCDRHFVLAADAKPHGH